MVRFWQMDVVVMLMVEAVDDGEETDTDV